MPAIQQSAVEMDGIQQALETENKDETMLDQVPELNQVVQAKEKSTPFAQDLTNLLTAEYVPRKINSNTKTVITQTGGEDIEIETMPNTWEMVCLLLPMAAVLLGIGVGLQIAKTEDEIMMEKAAHMKDEDEEVAAGSESLIQNSEIKKRNTKKMIKEEFEFEAEDTE